MPTNAPEGTVPDCVASVPSSKADLAAAASADVTKDRPKELETVSHHAVIPCQIRSTVVATRLVAIPASISAFETVGAVHSLESPNRLSFASTFP
ncbi:MAG: hypothetical protein ACK55I_12690, partial [bacterium]